MHRFTLPKISLAFVAALGACSSPPTNLYLIDAELTERSRQMSVSEQDVISIAKIELPTYARDERVIRRGLNHRLIADDDNRWAEPPEDSLTRVLAANLGHQLDATALVEPLPRGLPVSRRVHIIIDRFLLNDASYAEWSGYAAILSGDGRLTLHIVPFDMSTPSASSSVGDYATAIEQNLEELALVISEQIQGN